MLQQTQVSRVVPRYHAFLERFPDATACAAARPGEVVDAWAGLGYNRRAVNLHRAATGIRHRFAGKVPDGLADLLSLDGVGPYTARAVMAFAFERPVGVVDTNVGRVLARAVAGRPLRPAEAQRLADGLVPAERSWAWNQAMLDLGATVCTKRAPSCARCPLAAGDCAWRARGDRADPSHGSAGTSGIQSTFEGSDRQGRGRLVAALRLGPLAPADLARAAGWPTDPARAGRVAAGLVTDGLAIDDGGLLRLP